MLVVFILFFGIKRLAFRVKEGRMVLVIKSFGSKLAERIFKREVVHKLDLKLLKRVKMKLDMLQ